MDNGDIEKRKFDLAGEAADKAVPEFRSGSYSCTGVYGKRWSAAYDAAMFILDIQPDGWFQDGGWQGRQQIAEAFEGDEGTFPLYDMLRIRQD